MAAARRVVDESESPFYIGITSGPSFRYMGGVTDSGNNSVKGHQIMWRHMVVIGQCCGRSGPNLERELVDWAMDEHGKQCANIARSGCCIAIAKTSIAYLYVCHTRAH